MQRLALDYRIHLWAKWHTTAEAKRLGELTVELEKLLHRDGRTLDEALVIARDPQAEVQRDHESLAALADRLPAPREVAIADFSRIACGQNAPSTTTKGPRTGG